MALFGRRRLPAERRPPLAPDERVLAWSDGDSGVLVATNLGLWLPSPADGSTGRVGWHEINKATWSGTDLVVTAARQVEERAGYVVVADQPPATFRLRDPGELPHQV